MRNLGSTKYPFAWYGLITIGLIINLAIGGAWGGQQGIDNNIFPQKYLIDYVRVYSK